MTDPRLYEQNNFVLLESGRPEEILTVDELKEKLAHFIETYPDDVPEDIATVEGIDQQVQSLVDSYCELTLGPSQFVQWFAIRLEK